MNKISFVPLVVGLLMALLVIGGDTSQTAEATHGNLNVHVHDDFYHPAGAFGSPTDHTAAAAACMVADPAAACDAQIHVGDTITWVTAAPQAANPHTVTECTDNTFSVCGAAVDANNPIGDSGVRQPAPATPPTGWPYGPVTFTATGTYYYRCDVHQATMRGRVVVAAAVQTSTPTPTPATSAAPTTSPTGTPASVPVTGGSASDGGQMTSLAIIATVTGALLLAGSAGLALKRRRS